MTARILSASLVIRPRQRACLPLTSATRPLPGRLTLTDANFLLARGSTIHELAVSERRRPGAARCSSPKWHALRCDLWSQCYWSWVRNCSSLQSHGLMALDATIVLLGCCGFAPAMHGYCMTCSSLVA